MKVSAALLLTVLLVGAATADDAAPTKTVPTEQRADSTPAPPPPTQPKKEAVQDDTTKLSDLLPKAPVLKPLLNPEEMLLREIFTLDKDASSAKIQDEVEQTLKAESQRISKDASIPTSPRPAPVKADDKAMEKLVEEEDDAFTYDDGVGMSDDEEDESEDDDYDDDEDTEDELLSVEDDVMAQCPDYCRCAGLYAATTTATCTKLVKDQAFGISIVHLHIENAGEIRLGPHALRSRGLQQLESIKIVDTRIMELDPTAFDGATYLFSVNLTRNGLQDIHPNTFRNNTKLGHLIISGNPLKHIQESKERKHGLFDAPSVSQFDFTYNGLTRLKRNAFAKMPKLSFINLKGNRLKEIDPAVFNSLTDSLEEVNLSDNLLNEIPTELFYNIGVQDLRISGNNLTTLDTIKSPKLVTLEASNNKIKVLAKDDLSGMPMLDRLSINGNGIKRIHQHAFAGLTQLTNLDISNNKLTNFTEHHLRTNSRLQVLLMSDNPALETLPIFKPSGLEYETYSVFRFECANCGLKHLAEGTFNAMPALLRLNLAKNRLSGLPKGLLSSMTSLRVLDLSDNNINTLDVNMFHGATSMNKLSLAGNPLVTLQVTPFLKAPSLTRLDVSRCALKRVWTEARSPLKSLRYLSLRENLLGRITTEELKAMPKLSGLDLTQNPLMCDADFNEAIQWLTDNGVYPTETMRYASNYGMDEDYAEADGISSWTDLAKMYCKDVTNDGPPPRPVPHDKKSKTPDEVTDDGFDHIAFRIDHGVTPSEEVENAWIARDQEYEDFTVTANTYSAWYSGAFWPVVTVIVVTLMILLMTAHIAVYFAKKRGRGPVLRPPMILRQGLIDNKNCGLVYKPLQEEIATPHMPKRGSFYSSSTFHYDKIVPESV